MMRSILSSCRVRRLTGTGNRVGYGAGFYDKLLSSFTKMTVALAFEAQIVPLVPAESHDVPVMKIVTEKRVINATANRVQEQRRIPLLILACAPPSASVL